MGGGGGNGVRWYYVFKQLHLSNSSQGSNQESREAFTCHLRSVVWLICHYWPLHPNLQLQSPDIPWNLFPLLCSSGPAQHRPVCGQPSPTSPNAKVEFRTFQSTSTSRTSFIKPSYFSVYDSLDFWQNQLVVSYIKSPQRQYSKQFFHVILNQLFIRCIFHISLQAPCVLTQSAYNVGYVHIRHNQISLTEVVFSQGEEGTFLRLSSCYTRINFETSGGGISGIAPGECQFQGKEKQSHIFRSSQKILQQCHISNIWGGGGRCLQVQDTNSKQLPRGFKIVYEARSSQRLAITSQ